MCQEWKYCWWTEKTLLISFRRRSDVTYQEYCMIAKKQEYPKTCMWFLYSVWSVHFWITAEGKTKYIHLECTHRIIEDVPQIGTFSVWYPDIPLARVYYRWTWQNYFKTTVSYAIWSHLEPVKNSNALRGQLIL